MSSHRQPDVETEQGVTVVHFGTAYENLEETLLDELREQIFAIVEAADPPKVVLDLSHTRFFGSAFIEVMFQAWKRLEARGGTLAISGLTPYAAEVIAVTHLDRLWKSYPDHHAAVAALAS